MHVIRIDMAGFLLLLSSSRCRALFSSPFAESAHLRRAYIYAGNWKAHSISLANDGREKAFLVADRSPIRVEGAIHKVICLHPNIGDTDWVESHVQSVQDE